MRRPQPIAPPLRRPAQVLRLREGAQVNQALFALRTLLRALSSGASTEQAEYAQSKLTLLLSEALGGARGPAAAPPPPSQRTCACACCSAARCARCRGCGGRTSGACAPKAHEAQLAGSEGPGFPER